jgi:hypothetical protein
MWVIRALISILIPNKGVNLYVINKVFIYLTILICLRHEAVNTDRWKLTSLLPDCESKLSEPPG